MHPNALRMVGAAAVLLAACATAPPPPPMPEWDAVPPHVLAALCSRLRLDGIGTEGRLLVVATTRPIATPDSVRVLAAYARRPVPPERLEEAIREGGRTIPLTLATGACAWEPLARHDPRGHRDEMVVEVSAPLRHPAFRGEWGLFARASLGTQQEWYWIAVTPSGGNWWVRHVTAIAK